MGASGTSRPGSAERRGCGRSGRTTATPSPAPGRSPRRSAARAGRAPLAEHAPPPPFLHHGNIFDMTTLLPRSRSGRLLGVALIAAVAVAGCSGKGVKKLTVNGTISYQGKPLRSGILKFVGPEAAYSAAVIQ